MNIKEYWNLLDEQVAKEYKLASEARKKDFSLTPEPEIYVGNIDSDDYETVDYTLNVKSFEKSVELPLEIIYMDSTNKKHQEKTSLELKTYSPSKVSTVISGMINLVITIVIIAVILYVGYRFYKKRKAKRKG